MLKYISFFIFSLSLLFLFLPQILRAEPLFGFSYLGICHKNWPCDESIKAYDTFPDLYLSFLYDETFGSDCPCARKFYEDERDKTVRIHITNGPGLRNKRLQKNEVFYGHTIQSAEKAIIKNDPELFQKFSAVAKRAQNDFSNHKGLLKLFVSPCLECDFSKETRKILIKWTKQFLPQAEYVDNPLNDSCLDGFICEKHSKDAILYTPCIFDTDGFDARNINLNKFYDISKNCLARFLWVPEFNLNKSLTSQFTPPQERDGETFGVPQQFLSPH